MTLAVQRSAAEAGDDLATVCMSAAGAPGPRPRDAAWPRAIVQRALQQQALARIRLLLAIGDVAVDDVTTTPPHPASGTSGRDVRYRNPVTGTTWSGRGRVPHWLRAAVDAGCSLEEFRIPCGVAPRPLGRDLALARGPNCAPIAPR